MDYTKLFYWLTVADNARFLFVTLIAIFTAVSVITSIGYLIIRSEGGDHEITRKWVWFSTPIAIFFWLCFIFTPSKKDALLIIAGGQTLNYLANDSIAKEIPRDILSFVQVELRQMAGEAKVELGIDSQRQRIIDEAKSLTVDELIKRMKTDTTFAKVLMD